MHKDGITKPICYIRSFVKRTVTETRTYRFETGTHTNGTRSYQFETITSTNGTRTYQLETITITNGTRTYELETITDPNGTMMHPYETNAVRYWMHQKQDGTGRYRTRQSQIQNKTEMIKVQTDDTKSDWYHGRYKWYEPN